MTQRFENTFAKLEKLNEGAFMPFVSLCDPNFDTSLEILKTVIDSGADALELGFPFSDPSADGPVIQQSDKRALNSGANTDDFFRIIKKIREYNNDIPVSILVYANVVLARGINRFYKDAADAGIDAVLIPDIPCNMLNTCDDFEKCAKDNDVDLVLIAPPNASEDTIKTICSKSKGYTYVVSRFGITGTDSESGYPVEVIESVKMNNGPAPVLGFGISKPDHVRSAIKAGAKGAISGSAIVKIIANNLDNTNKMKSEISSFIKAMKEATKQ